MPEAGPKIDVSADPRTTGLDPSRLDRLVPVSCLQDDPKIQAVPQQRAMNVVVGARSTARLVQRRAWSLHPSVSLLAPEQYMQSLVDGGHCPHAMTLVSRNGKVAFCKGVGLQNDGTKASLAGQAVPLREDTILRIYSMSKPIT